MAEPTPEERIARHKALRASHGQSGSSKPGSMPNGGAIASKKGITAMGFLVLTLALLLLTYRYIRQKQLGVLADMYSDQLGEIKKINGEFSDNLKVAGSTGRIALEGPVSRLQATSRRLAETQVGACLEEPKDKIKAGMDFVVDGFLYFMDADNPESLSSAAIRVGSQGISDGLSDAEACTDVETLKDRQSN